MKITNFFISLVQYGLFILRFFLYLKSDFLALLSVKIVVVFFPVNIALVESTDK